MTTLLALDTATEVCSVALLHKNQITYEINQDKQTHGEIILPMIDKILHNANISLKDLDAIVFGQGPGGFTGVRMGISAVLGLALGSDLPIIPVSDLTTMAQEAYCKYAQTTILASIDARMNEVYFSKIQISNINNNIMYETIIPEQVISPENLLNLINDENNVIYVGTGWLAYEPLAQYIHQKNSSILIQYPSARYMLDLGLQKYKRKEFADINNIEPSYLRNEVTWKKLSEQHK